MVKIVAVICPQKITSVQFVKSYLDRIEEAIKDPSAHILISEINTRAYSFLAAKRFRNLTIYHLGETPTVEMMFKTKGGFTSYVEIDETLRSIADVVID